MLSFKRLALPLITVALITTPFASRITEAQTAAPTAAVACDPTFGADAQAVFASIQTDKLDQPSLIGNAAVSLIKLRYEYEDLTAPTGCEAGRLALIKVAALDEDVLFLDLAARTDKANVAVYDDFVKNVWQPRFNAFKASLSATPDANATAAATPSATVSATDSGAVCTDAKIQGQVSADVGGFPNLKDATISILGNAGLTVMKIRYTYEDEKAPAGCTVALKDARQFMALGEDTIFLNLLDLTDSTNKKKYDDFHDSAVQQRILTLSQTFNNDLGFATIPAPTATPGS